MNPKQRVRGLRNSRARLVERLENSHPELAAQLQGLKLDWYRLRNSATASDTTEFLIYEEIGGWWGVPADELVRELSDIKTSNIDVRINSPGGSVFDSIAIYNALVRHPANIHVYVDALAASGASIIAMSGDIVTMMVGSQMMIHDALGFEWGNEADFLDYASFLGAQSDNIATVYAARAGGDPADWRTQMKNETWMFAQEAVDAGLADDIYTKPDTPPEPPNPAPDPNQQDGEDGTTPVEAADEEDETDDDGVEALLTRQHAVASMGFRYNGRKSAPGPKNTSKRKSDRIIPAPIDLSDDELDKFIAAFQKTLGGNTRGN